MTIEELKDICQAHNLTLTAEMCTSLQTYSDLLREWNEKINLTAITDPEEIMEKHFCDSLLPLFDIGISGKIVDVGTGAGFPGLVWKIVRPDLNVDLLEPTGKRCTFLKTVIETLQLKGTAVINARAEDYAKEARETYDVVTARAVANLPVLAELCLPLTKVNGIFLAMKGSQGEAEAEAAAHAVKELGGELQEKRIHELPSGTRVNLIYKKVMGTPKKYPRAYGQIKKKPL